MSAPGRLVLKCTSVDATARIPIQHLGDGPGTSIGPPSWLLRRSDEVEVHDGDVEPLCTEIATDTTAVDLDAQFSDTSVGAQPAEEGGNISRNDMMFIFVPDGSNPVTGVTIIITAFSASGTNGSFQTNVGKIDVRVQAEDTVGVPPTPEMLAENSCGLVGLGPTGDDFDTRYSLVGSIGDGVSSPTPGSHLVDFGFAIHSPMVIKITTEITVAPSLDVLFRTQATIASVSLV